MEKTSSIVDSHNKRGEPPPSTPMWTTELELEPKVDYGTGIRTKVDYGTGIRTKVDYVTGMRTKVDYGTGISRTKIGTSR
jgi:hypothetical protein